MQQLIDTTYIQTKNTHIQTTNYKEIPTTKYKSSPLVAMATQFINCYNLSSCLVNNDAALSNDLISDAVL